MILIVYASPNPEGNSSTILKEVELNLKRKKEKYEVLDLYKINYDPVLRYDELYTVGNRKVSSQNKKIQSKIKKTDKLIFIYPVWWNSMPAIMKGFLDKVFTGRFGFRYKRNIAGVAVPEGLLKGKKAAVFINSGAQVFLSKTYQAGRAGKLISIDVLKFCGIRSRVFQTGKGDKPNEEKKKIIKKTVTKGLNWLLR